jgi:aryl-alcohol dehydrogenase-like predicted oxidoreductase
VETALELDRLRRAGKIARLGITNFDTARLGELVRAGLPIAAHQLQYSLVDCRPESSMIEFCRVHDIAVLCYGTVCGGFLSERWLGRAEPPDPPDNRSLIKYKLIIEDFGGWSLFQELLAALSKIAVRRGTDIATVATRAILDTAQVAAAIVGATNTAHLGAHARIGGLRLDDRDREEIAAVTRRRLGPAGDVYSLERDREGRHGQIMKYELNSPPSGAAPIETAMQGAPPP